MSHTSWSGDPNTSSHSAAGSGVGGAQSAVASFGTESFNRSEAAGTVKSAFFAHCVAALRRRLLLSNKIEEEASEVDQRRGVEIARRNSMARKLSTSPNVTIAHQVALLDNAGRTPTALVFHPHAPLVLVADATSTISLWHYGDQITGCTSSVRNPNAIGTRLTSLLLLNESDPHLGLILVGSDDGIVRAWRGFGQRGEETLVGGWKTVPDMRPSPRGPGLVLHMLGNQGRLLAGGDSPFLRVWDLQRERCAQTLPTHASGALTAITSCGDMNKAYMVTGAADGAVRLFDSRASNQEPAITLNEHGSFIVGVEPLLSRGPHQLISGANTGEVKIWDLRGRRSVTTMQVHKERMSAMAVHPYAPLVATGSDGIINLHNISGEAVHSIKYHDGFLGQRIGPVRCLALHPLKLVLAAGATDSIISIYSQ